MPTIHPHHLEAAIPYLWATYQLCVGYVTLHIIAAIRRDTQPPPPAHTQHTHTP